MTTDLAPARLLRPAVDLLPVPDDPRLVVEVLEVSIREKHALLKSLWRQAFRHWNDRDLRRALIEGIRPVAHLQRDLRAHRRELAEALPRPAWPWDPRGG